MYEDGQSTFNRYYIAVILVIAAVLLRMALMPLIGTESPFILLYPAIALSALYGGFRAGLVSVILGAILVAFAVMDPQFGFRAPNASDGGQLVLLLIVGTFVSWAVSDRQLISTNLERLRKESEDHSRKVAKALRESEERSRLAQTTSGVGVWEWDLRTDKLKWSEGIYQLTGVERNVAPTLETWNQLILPEDAERSKAYLAQQIESEATEYYDEFRIRRQRDGEVRWLSTRGKVVRENGIAVRLIGVNIDITQTKENELRIQKLNAELRRRLGELQTIFDLSPVGIAVAHDAECSVITANPALAKMVGVEPGTNVSVDRDSLPYIHIKNGQVLESNQMPMQRAVAERRTITDDELEIRRADGSTITIYSYAAPVFDENGDVVSCVAAQIDITERKQRELQREQALDAEQAMRKQAEEANRLKDEFLATVSHELRTPLNSIIGWTTMLRDHAIPEEMRARAVAAIDRGAKSQSQLIEDLLDVSRIISGKLQLVVKPVDLNSVIMAAVETLRPAAEAKNIQIRAHRHREPVMILGDSDRLQQIVWNLLSNAVKFTPNGGEAEVRIEKSDGKVEIAVSDSGQGIQADFLPYVFDRFRQADGSITRSYTGLGLGLAIVRHLVELHGGRVIAASEGQDKGCTFTVELPAMTAVNEETGHEDLSASASFAEQPALMNARVLVVDDDENTREILKLTFERCGADVATAATATDAFAAVRDWEPQVMVSDIGMPLRDGYSLIDDIRRWENETLHEMTPAVALTAYARPEDRLKAIQAGYDAHITKPVDPNELTNLVASLLESKRAN